MTGRHHTLGHFVDALGALGFRLGFAILGWSIGHDLAYALTAPLDRAALEGAHGYVDAAMVGGQLATLLGFALVLRTILRRGTFGAWIRETGEGTLLATAVGVPVAAFLALEFGERALAGVAVVPDTRLLLVGVLVQAVLGLLVLGIVRWSLRVASELVEALRRPLETTLRGVPQIVVATRVIDAASIIATRSGWHRGPPVTA